MKEKRFHALYDIVTRVTQIFILVSKDLHLPEVERTSSAIRLTPETNIPIVGSVLTSGRATERDILLVVQSCLYRNRRT